MLNVGTPLVIVLSGSDIDGDDLTYTISTQPTKGSLSNASGNQVIYTATAGATGADTFQYRVNDGTSNSIEYTITVNINNPPTGAIQTVDVNVGTPLDIILSGSDIDGDDLTYTISSQPTKGSLSNANGNQVTYTATAGATGVDTFQYRVNDGTSNSINYTITVNISNPPTGAIQTVAVEVGTSLDIVLSGSDIDGDNLTYTISTQPTKGSLSNANGNQLTYEANANASGTDSFQYTVSDGTLTSTASTVSITLRSVNERTEELNAKTDAVGMSDDQINILKTTEKSNGILDLGNDINALFINIDKTKKKKRRHSVARTVFAQHKFKDETIIKMKKENLGLSSRVTRANINVIKPGETIDASVDKSADTSWYSAIEHTEFIDIKPISGSTYTITRTDVSVNVTNAEGEQEVESQAQYSLALTNNGILEVRTTSTTYLNESPPYFIDGEDAVINGEQLVFGGVEGGANPPTGANQTVAVTAGQSVVVDLSGSDVDTSYNFLVFDISGTAPTKGSLKDLCGNQVTYEANQEVSGVDTFQYFVNDTSNNSALYTITVNITASGGGGAGADPFVWPVHGKAYETPMKATAYRMLQGRKLIMNMSQRRMTKQEGEVVEQYYKQVNNEEAPKSLVTKGVYINKAFLKADGQVMEYDFDTGKGQMSSDYFTITQETKKHGDGIYLSSPIVKQIHVSFRHSIYGNMTATLNHYSNPQMKSGVTINYNTNKPETKELTGLLVREYKCKSMECRKLRKTKKLQGKLGNNKVLGYLNDKPKN